jgi:predicted ATPase
LPLTAVAIQGYRSVQNLFLPVDACSVFVGANGVGKTNLYKALGLLRAAADGSITRAIAEEGGLESVLWAGNRRRGKPVRLVLKAHFDTMEYGVEVGLPHSYEIEIGLRQADRGRIRDRAADQGGASHHPPGPARRRHDGAQAIAGHAT